MNYKDNIKNVIEKDFDKGKNYNRIMNKINKNKINNLKKYIISSCMVLLIMAFSIVLLPKKCNNLKKCNLDQRRLEDTIIFNNGNIKQSLDIDGKAVDTEIITKFDFLNNLDIPDEYKLERSYEMYERENKEDLDYTKLWQYEMYYISNKKSINNCKNIEIIFTKEDYILACMLPDKNEFSTSIINGQEINLFSAGNNNTRQAFLEFNGYKFYIEANSLTEEEFINLIKSIIK